ncbi:hypothetical protein GCM10010216_14970 [Streptomyces flaveolus]|nr:hypothetical protein GCM10010216_14970 [Streptomyces flaveolus]
MKTLHGRPPFAQIRFADPAPSRPRGTLKPHAHRPEGAAGADPAAACTAPRGAARTGTTIALLRATGRSPS